MEYCIVSEYIGYFEKVVNKKLKEGWRLHGNVVATKGSTGILYIQAFTKIETV